MAASAALLHASAISRLICITTASMLRLTTMSRLQRAAMPRQMRQHGASDAVDQCIDIDPPHQLAPFLHQPHLQHLGLYLDVISVGLRARGWAILAPQVTQV